MILKNHKNVNMTTFLKNIKTLFMLQNDKLSTILNRKFQTLF